MEVRGGINIEVRGGMRMRQRIALKSCAHSRVPKKSPRMIAKRCLSFSASAGLQSAKI